MAHHAEPLTLHSFAQPSMWEQLQLLPINPVSSALSSALKLIKHINIDEQ
jgi:hypothetical protein